MKMKNKLLLSSALFIAAISTASAADLSRPVYTKAPPPAPMMFNWTGFYVGLNVGGKWATTDGRVDVAAIPGFAASSATLASTTASTAIGGGQIGYNWQAPGSLWVFGVEGDIDAQHWSTTRTIATTGGSFVAGDSFTVDSHWQASLRGRIGYAAWDRALLYVTGGVAFTQMRAGALFGPVGAVPGTSATDDQTVVGGTVGAGLEYALTNNLSLGLEGRWTFYGDRTFSGTLGGIPVSDKVSLDTAEVMGKLNFRFGGY
jgi:outer membrane immunogenic protein